MAFERSLHQRCHNHQAPATAIANVGVAGVLLYGSAASKTKSGVWLFLAKFDPFVLFGISHGASQRTNFAPAANHSLMTAERLDPALAASASA